jgi:thiamine biosynthesis protein ThiS
MKILINGENADARGAKTIAELIDRYEVPPQTVMIEHNGVALHRHEWSSRAIAERDRIEFLRVVAGG